MNIQNGDKIAVKETIKNSSGYIVLVTEMFTDEIVTKKLETNIGAYTSFMVDPVRKCFSETRTRVIVIMENGIDNYERIEYVYFG